MANTQKDTSFRGKENRLWKNVPNNMKKYFRAEISNISSKFTHWILVFTADQESRENQKPGNKWRSKVWIWDSEQEAWKCKLLFDSTRGIEYYFFHHKYERLIIVTQAVWKELYVYSFDGKELGAYEFTRNREYPVFWQMLDENTLFISDNHTVWYEYNIQTQIYYQYTSFYYNTPIKEVISIQKFEKFIAIVTKAVLHDRMTMYRITFWNNPNNLFEQKLLPDKDASLASKYYVVVDCSEIVLPALTFPTIEIRADKEHVYITGMLPILISTIPINPHNP